MPKPIGVEARSICWLLRDEWAGLPPSTWVRDGRSVWAGAGHLRKSLTGVRARPTADHAQERPMTNRDRSSPYHQAINPPDDTPLSHPRVPASGEAFDPTKPRPAVGFRCLKCGNNRYEEWCPYCDTESRSDRPAVPMRLWRRRGNGECLEGSGT